MRIASRRLLKLSAAILLLTSSVLWLFRDSLMVQYHLGALHRAEQRMFAPQPSTVWQHVVAFLGRRPSWEVWSARRGRHEEALIRMGYFSRREFSFTNHQITAVKLSTNAQRHFASRFSSLIVITNGQRLSGNTVASNSIATIIGPATEMDDWSDLISELEEGGL